MDAKEKIRESRIKEAVLIPWAISSKTHIWSILLTVPIIPKNLFLNYFSKNNRKFNDEVILI